MLNDIDNRDEVFIGRLIVRMGANAQHLRRRLETISSHRISVSNARAYRILSQVRIAGDCECRGWSIGTCLAG